MTTEKQFFCYRPWLHLQIKSSGAIKFCCYSKDSLYLDDGTQAQALKANLSEVMNCSKMKEVRKSLLEGIPHPSCRVCWDTEASGATSLRQKINKRWDQVLTAKSLIESTDPDGYLKHPQIHEIEFRLGNICNLKCRMCNPLNSIKMVNEYLAIHGKSLIREDQEVFDLEKDLSLFKWHETIDFLKWISPYTSNLIDVQFAGGEPFLSPTHNGFLKLFIDSGISKKLALRYTTNGTILNEETLQLWKNFREVTVSISIDGKDKVYEYIRQDSKWSLVLSNLHRLDSLVGTLIQGASLQPTPNVYNIFSLPTMPYWAFKEFKNIGWTTHLNFQTSPNWQSAYILTNDEKAKCTEICRSEISRIENDMLLSSDTRSSVAIKWLNGLIDTLMLHDWTHLRNSFAEKNKKMDEYRQVDGKFLATDFQNLF